MGRAAAYGYVFRDLVVDDRRLQFGWRNSPGYFCLSSAALEHAHRHTLFGDAVVVEAGQNDPTRRGQRIGTSRTPGPLPPPAATYRKGSMGGSRIPVIAATM